MHVLVYKPRSRPDVFPGLIRGFNPIRGSTTPRSKISRFNGNDLVAKVMENNGYTIDQIA
jgi:hypothetical protein